MSFSTTRQDLILMDIQMPIMDGLTAIHKIRELEAQQSGSNGVDSSRGYVPIIALTALAMPDDLEKCMDAGADGYLTKPVKLKELVAEIDRRIVESEK